MTLATWLDMGGYAIFVWPAYGIAGAALGLLAIGSIRRYRMAQRRLARITGARRGEDS
jgi:heme exporter protein CcmD